METQIVNATEYRNVTLALLSESKTNPRRTFEEVALKELASSIRTQGVLSPLLVRPLTETGFEIIAGARRYRAAQMAEVSTVPVRIVHLSDAAALEAQLVENLIRSEIHPMEEAQGFRALLDLEDPKYSIEQIAAKVGKSPVFVASRLKLSDLVPAAVEAFYADAIGVGHALLLAKLPADQQEDDAKRPEFKVCKFTTEAIITEGADVGTIHKVCANPTCPVHHPKQPTSRNDEKWKAEQDKQRKEQAIANTTGLRVLAAVSAAVPVRLLKRDLLFIIEKLVNVMDGNRIEMLARQHGIRQKRDDGGIGKTLTAFLRRTDEGTLSRLMVEASILLASSRGNPTSILKDAATAYKVDTEAIALKVKQEFAAKEKAKKVPQPAAKAAKKVA